MKTKYFKYTIKGEHSAEDAQRAIGDFAPQGLVVRVDNIGGQTFLYIAAQPTGAAISAKKMAAPSGVSVEEISELDVIKLI